MKQKDIDRNNSKENNLRVSCNQQVGAKVLITSNDTNMKLNCPTKCPYPVVQVYSNSRVCDQKHKFEGGEGYGVSGLLQ